MTEAKEMIRRLAMVLDVSIPALDAAARLEKRREEGKSMRQITEQERAKIARKLVADAEAYLYPRDPDDIEDESFGMATMTKRNHIDIDGLLSRPQACFCIGPQNGEPFCRCEMRRRKMRIVNGRWVEPEHDHGPATSTLGKAIRNDQA